MCPRFGRTGFSLSHLLHACKIKPDRLKPVLLEAKTEGAFMAARIEIEKFDASHFRVRVIDEKSETFHQVTLSAKDRERLAGGAAEAEELIRESFRFLLEREPKESILARFDLSVIGRYFPEYEQEIKAEIARSKNGLAILRV